MVFLKSCLLMLITIMSFPKLEGIFTPQSFKLISHGDQDLKSAQISGKLVIKNKLNMLGRILNREVHVLQDEFKGVGIFRRSQKHMTWRDGLKSKNGAIRMGRILRVSQSNLMMVGEGKMNEHI
jgi:hypothetical protein